MIHLTGQNHQKSLERTHAPRISQPRHATAVAVVLTQGVDAVTRSGTPGPAVPATSAPATIAPFDLAARCAEAISLAQTAMSVAGQPGGLLVARYLDEVTEVPGLVALGAHDRERLIAILVGWPCASRTWWSHHVRPALARSSNEGWLDDAFEVAELHVHPDVQGHGLGTKLLAKAATEVRQPRMVLSTNVENDNARAFYRRRGFRTLTGAFRWLGTDLRVLVLGRETAGSGTE